MSTLTIAIIVVFVAGYLCIALESVTKVNKAAVALLMFVFCWTLFMVDPGSYLTGFTGEALIHQVSTVIEEHLGSTSTTLFFLMGAMTIVEIVDQNGGFDWVRKVMKSRSKRSLLWRIAFMTFFLSAILDNLTTSIVMIMILRKLVHNRQDRIIYASLVIIAANSGGAFSPIGDVTTIMLWNAGMITAAGVIEEIFIPSLVSMIIPAFIMQTRLKGELENGSDGMANDPRDGEVLEFSGRQRKTIFSVTEVFYRQLHRQTGRETFHKRVTSLLSHIDMSTILFFLGILMAVACLEEVGVLTALGGSLNTTFNGNHYLVTGIIGVLSSIVDNVPLVAGCMGMYPIQAAGDMAVDGIFWQLLAYCAGVGGSILIIGSAAGVVVMGLEKITFGWYMKNVSWIALVGYLVGIFCYWVIRQYILVVS